MGVGTEVGVLLGEWVGSVEAGEHRVVHSGCVVVGVHAFVVDPAVAYVQAVGSACLRCREVVWQATGVIGGELVRNAALVHHSHSGPQIILDVIIMFAFREVVVAHAGVQQPFAPLPLEGYL